MPICNPSRNCTYLINLEYFFLYSPFFLASKIESLIHILFLLVSFSFTPFDLLHYPKSRTFRVFYINIFNELNLIITTAMIYIYYFLEFRSYSQ